MTLSVMLALIIRTFRTAARFAFVRLATLPGRVSSFSVLSVARPVARNIRQVTSVSRVVLRPLAPVCMVVIFM